VASDNSGDIWRRIAVIHSASSRVIGLPSGNTRSSGGFVVIPPFVQQPARDHLRLNFRRTFKNVENPGIA
jgi:hypothetical protein